MSAMIQDYGSDTISMVFHSISPRVECEDFFRVANAGSTVARIFLFRSPRHFQTIDLSGIVGWNMRGFPFSRR